MVVSRERGKKKKYPYGCENHVTCGLMIMEGKYYLINDCLWGFRITKINKENKMDELYLASASARKFRDAWTCMHKLINE